MTLTKTFGFSLPILFLLISCSTIKKIEKQSQLLQDFYCYYLNDAIKFSFRCPGDYIIDNNKSNGQKTNKIFTLLQNRCISTLRTTVSPYFIQKLYYFPNEDIVKYNLSRLSFHKKGNYYVNEEQFAMGNFFLVGPKKECVLMISVADSNTFSSLQLEYSDIYNHFIIGKNYKNITNFISPFDLGSKQEFNLDSSVNYLYPLFLLEKSKNNYMLSPSDRSLWFQAKASYLSRLTNQDEITTKTEREWRGKNYVNDQTIKQLQIIDYDTATINSIIQQCRENQVVMLNENHFLIEHRMLLYLLLDSLRKAGFDYLALESLWEHDTAINDRGFAISTSGFYCRDPLMSDIIRKAINLGYHIIGYDDFGGDREKQQAENIYTKAIAQNKNNKVIVLAGMDHIDEKQNKMANEFYRISGINPLTINQTDYYSNDYTLSQIDISSLEKRRSICDIYIANNINYNWLANYLNFKTYLLSIPDTLFSVPFQNSYQYVINIYKVDEYENDKKAIPVFNYLLETFQMEIPILLPSNEYVFVIKNLYGNVLFKGSIIER